MPKITKTKGVYLHSEARWSKAYRDLTNTARDILRLAMEKRQIFEGQVINNGHIEITHGWVMKELGKSKQCVSNGFRQLIGHGLLKIRIRGEGRQPHKYYVLITNQPKDDKDARWRYYPEKNWFPPKSRTTIGKETRWKEGESGRKNTLQKYTSNGNNEGFVV